MVILKRSDRRGFEQQEPLTWLPVHMKDNTLNATIVCVNGHEGWLSEHTIDADGVVTPSCVCPIESCDWHEMIQLQDWQNEFII